jgi:orotate phosphoribosyltransferase
MASFDGEGLSLIVQAIIAELEGIASSAIGGMDIGATPIVAGVALRMEQLKKPYPAFVVRKSCEKIEGPIPPAPCNVVVVDDVVTSGGSILQAIDALEAAGYRVVLAIGVVDRDAGGREALGARAIPYQPLVTLSDLGLKNED